MRLENRTVWRRGSRRVANAGHLAGSSPWGALFFSPAALAPDLSERPVDTPYTNAASVCLQRPELARDLAVADMLREMVDGVNEIMARYELARASGVGPRRVEVDALQ